MSAYVILGCVFPFSLDNWLISTEHKFSALPISVMLFFSRAASSRSISCASSSCLFERAQSVAVCADRLRTFKAVWFHLYKRIAVSRWPLAHAHIWNINYKEPSSHQLAFCILSGKLLTMDQYFMKPGSQRSLPTTEFCVFFLNLYHQYWGQDSTVGIVTCYRLYGTGIENPVEARFSACIQACPGVWPASCTMNTGSFPGVK